MKIDICLFIMTIIVVAKFTEFKNRVLRAQGEKIVYIYSSDNSVDETLFEVESDIQ